MGGFGFPQAERLEYRAPAPVQAMFELRPLSVGEILDRTFTLYRRRFWLYVGLSSVTAAVATVSQFVQISLGLTGRAPQANASDPAAMMRLGLTTIGVFLVVLLVQLLAYSITQAASVSAVEASYLGQETSIGAAFETVKGRWYRYVLVAFWQGWSILWPMLAVIVPASILAGVIAAAGGGKGGAAVGLALGFLLMIPAFVWGFINYLRNSLGIVACVSERLTVRQSMKRSKFLVADFKVRAFLIYLIMFVLAMAAGTVQLIPNLFLMTAHGPIRVGVEITALLITFMSSALVQPVGAVAFVLFYIDQRVRKEGFDVEMLLSRVTGEPVPARVGTSPFATSFGESPFSAPLGGTSAVPAAPAADSPFSSPFPAAPAKVEEDPFGREHPFGSRES